MSEGTQVYTHGHHEAVLRSHTWRTAENSAAFLLPHLKPEMKLLDAGCGPGTITADLAGLVGEVVALDFEPKILEQAKKSCDEKGAKNVTFTAGDVHKLPFEEATYDVNNAHKTLKHVMDPLNDLKEFRRVTKPGGIVAVRDSDYGQFTWFPASEALSSWQDLYRKVASSNGGEPDIGNMLHSFARRAGFSREKMTCTQTSWCYTTPSEIEWWSGLWADRITTTKFADTAIEKGFATKEELEGLAKGWRKWGKEEDAWFVVPCGEILCRV
jgi:ubiquinone/menaquinone biosynthesis C-methylase UbiE